MKKVIGKIVSVLFLFLLGVSLTACKSKNGEVENNTQETLSEKEYAYFPSFKKLDLTDDSNSYLEMGPVSNKKIDYLLTKNIEDNDNPGKYVNEYYLGTYNLESGEKNQVKLDDAIAANNEWMQAFAILDNGKICAVVEQYNEDTFEENYMVKTFSSEGILENSFSLSDFSNSDYFYISNVGISLKGDIVFTVEKEVVVCDSEGKLKFRAQAEDYIRTSLVDGDDVYVYAYSYENEKGKVSKLNYNDKKFDTISEFKNDINYAFLGKPGTLLLSGTNVVKQLDIKTGEIKDLWNWFEVDGADINPMAMLENEDGSYSVLYLDWSNEHSSYEELNITYEKVTPENKREVITYGCIYMDYRMREAISRFNKGNSKYRVIPVCYEEEYGWEVAYEKYGMDVTAGKFDIISADDVDYYSYAKNKAFLDLSPYYDKDGSFTEDKYFMNVLDAGIIEGKRYLVIPAANIITMASRKEFVGDKTSITLKDVMDIRKKYPDKAFLEYGSKASALYMFLLYSLDEFIDLEKGTCDFNKQEFIDLLEFANTFSDEMSFLDNPWENIRKGDVVFTEMNISEFEDYQMSKALLGDTAQIVGMPSNSQTKHILVPTSMYAISSKSKNPDGAWEFLRSLLGEEYQNIQYSMPILKSAFEEVAKGAMEIRGYYDEEGHFVETPHTTWGNGNEEIEIYAASKEDVEAVRKMLESAVPYRFYDNKLLEIISEEVDPFFKNQKSATEVANIIQSRIRIYLAEKN